MRPGCFKPISEMNHGGQVERVFRFPAWSQVTPTPGEGARMKDTVIRSLDGNTWNEGRVALKKKRI